jgi:soluble P-type ATPase
MKYEVPEVGVIELKTLILDLNGTLSVNGHIPSRAPVQLVELKKLGFRIILLTGDQRGTADDLCKELGIEYRVAKNAEEKGKALDDLGDEIDKETTVSVGNARIDIGTFIRSKVSIATLQDEGIHVGILKHVDILVPSITAALDLLIDPNTFCATMRK